MEYKEMKYQRERKVELLAKGNFYGFDWFVLNLGTHPTAYVDVGDNLYKEFEKYDTCDIPIECHGGVTYRKDTLNLEGSMEIGNFIGWDYAHAGDYAGYFGDDLVLGKDKKWTTEEIVEEVKNVCQQLYDRKNAVERGNMYTDAFFLGMKDGINCMVDVINFTIEAYKKDASEELLKSLNDLEEEIDACAKICGG
jgi:hypothetical protein